MSEFHTNRSDLNAEKSTLGNSPASKQDQPGLFLKLFGTLFVICLGAGYLAGRAESPKWDDPTNSPGLIQRTVGSGVIREIAGADDWIVEVDAQGRLASFRPQAKVRNLTYVCGPLGSKRYDPTTHKVTTPPPKPYQTAEMPRLGFSYLDTSSFLVGGSEAYTVVRGGRTVSESWAALTAGESLAKKIHLVAAAVVITGIGYGSGYYFGYNAHVPCGEPLFQTLLSSEVFWSAVESDVESALVLDHYWVFEYLEPGRDTSHDYDGWPEAVRPRQAVSAMSSEQYSRVVRVYVMSRREISSQDLMEEASQANVLQQVRAIRHGFPVSLACQHRCLGYLNQP